jgi:hypothetical protein
MILVCPSLLLPELLFSYPTIGGKQRIPDPVEGGIYTGYGYP